MIVEAGLVDSREPHRVLHNSQLTVAAWKPRIPFISSTVPPNAFPGD